MTDATTEFFAELERQGHEPLLDKVKATIRFEIIDGKRKSRWLVSIDRGDLDVSRRNMAADTTVRAERALFDRVVTGQANATAAVLRGTIAIDGEIQPLILFGRVFPGPPLARGAA